MTCNNCKYFHKITNLTYTANTSLVLTATNSGNISSLDHFCFVLPCSVNPASVVTGTPVPCYLTINGGNYPIQNKYGLPLLSDKLTRRKLYKAWFVTGTSSSWIQLAEFPTHKCDA